jgi:molybdopterin synthase sulfur carrier subunit
VPDAEKPFADSGFPRYPGPRMSIIVLAFAQSQDLFGFSSRELPCDPADTPRSLLLRLCPDADLSQLRVALDCEFATWDTPLGSARELAIIPPVSGG